jgi:hypothetical protein
MRDGYYLFPPLERCQAYFLHRKYEECGEEGEPHPLDSEPLALVLGLRNEAIKRYSMTLVMMDRSRVVLIN